MEYELRNKNYFIDGKEEEIIYKRDVSL